MKTDTCLKVIEVAAKWAVAGREDIIVVCFANHCHSLGTY